MATAAELAGIRAWCGTDVGNPGDTFDAIDIDDRLARLNSTYAVALEILRTRRADLAMSPAKIQVDGDFSQDATESIKALDRDIARLDALVAAESDGGVSTTSLMVRRTGR